MPGEIYQDDADPDDLAFDLNLGGQIGRYLADPTASTPDEDTAAAFYIGLNDYSEFTPTSPETALAEGVALVTAAVGSTISAAAAVVLNGVDTVLLYTMPSFRFFPLSQSSPSRRSRSATSSSRRTTRDSPWARARSVRWGPTSSSSTSAG
jgi:hypothetical protein